jgi:hypothetical protein
MTMASVSNFGDNPRLLFVCAVSRERLVARVVVCPRDGQRSVGVFVSIFGRFPANKPINSFLLN